MAIFELVQVELTMSLRRHSSISYGYIKLLSLTLKLRVPMLPWYQVLVYQLV